MKSLLRVGGVSVLLAAFAFGNAFSVGANAAGMETETNLLFFEDQSEVKDGVAVLTRLKNGVSMRLSTVNLKPKDAVTVWWVVFDEPTKCSDECDENDIFNLDADGEFILNDDGSPPINGAGVEAAQITVIRADGHVIDELFLDVVTDIIAASAADIQYVDMRYGNGFTIAWKSDAQTPSGDPEQADREMVATRGLE